MYTNHIFMSSNTNRVFEVGKCAYDAHECAVIFICREITNSCREPRKTENEAESTRLYKQYLPRRASWIISKNIDVENEQVNGTLCKMMSLSWEPGVKHNVIDKLRKGKLRPKRNGEAYHVPPPYRCFPPPPTGHLNQALF